MMQQICYDTFLQLEAYHLSGTAQIFPNHFHEEYVLGFLAGGRRQLWCKGRSYILHPHDMVIFNPRDNHECSPLGKESLDYYALNIKPIVLQDALALDTLSPALPYFSANVLPSDEIAQALQALCLAIFRPSPPEERKILWQDLLQLLLVEIISPPPGQSARIDLLCRYIEAHFAESLTLDDFLSIAQCSKSGLVRAFTRQVGVSPYRYLQTIRLNQAKKWLAQGLSVAQAAQQAGFADQSHFTRTFKNFTGLTPKRYQRIHTLCPPKKEE